MPRPTFRNVGESLSEAMVAAAEAKLGVKFSQPYRRFLLQINGGRPTPDTVGNIPVTEFCGIGETAISDVVDYALSEWKQGIAEDLVAIAYGEFGHTICIGTRGSKLGKIFVYDQEFNEYKLYAEDFDTFLDSFYEPDLSDLNDDDDDEDGDNGEDDRSPGT